MRRDEFFQGGAVGRVANAQETAQCQEGPPIRTPHHPSVHLLLVPFSAPINRTSSRNLFPCILYEAGYYSPSEGHRYTYTISFWHRDFLFPLALIKYDGVTLNFQRYFAL